MTDLLTDTEGDQGLLSEMIAGGYFFVKSSNKTLMFFEEISNFLVKYYATDNNLMARQCMEKHNEINCSRIPYRYFNLVYNSFF